MSEFRRRLMMAGGGEPLPVANGMLYWLDGKNITAGMTDWQCSTRIQCIVPSLKIRFTTSGNTLHAGECLEISGSNGGASAFTAANTKISANPFYTAGMQQTSDFTMEAVVNLALDAGSYLVGGVAYGGGSAEYWRYQLRANIEGTVGINYNNGSGWGYAIITNNGVISANVNYHICFQREGNNLRIYINGNKVIEEENTSYKIPITENCGIIGFGRYDRINNTSPKNGKGKFYSQAIYNRALSASEILHNYNVYFNRYNLT